MPKIKSSSSSSSSVSKHEGGEKERKKRAKREKKEERERRKRHEKKAAKSKKDDGIDSFSDKKKKRRSRMLLRKKKKKETTKHKTEAGNKKDGEETETESEWETDDDDSSVATGSEVSDVSDAEELSSDSSFTDSEEFETNDEESSASSSSVSSSSSSSSSASSLTHEVEKETKTKSHSRTRSSVALPEEKTSSTATTTAAANKHPEKEREKEIEKREEELENRYQQQQRRSNEERRQHYEKEPQKIKMKIVDDDSSYSTRGNGEFGQLSVDNFGCFIFCKDTIDEMSLQVKQTILSSHQGLPKLETTYAELITKTERIFGSLLERKKEADTKRNVLAALQRYRFVFDLPIRIKEHIQAEEFDKVVRDYNRAKTHLSQTNVGIFKQVLVEVEKLVENFRAELYRRLDDISATSPEEQENIIRLLGELKSEEDKEDPAWQYLKSLQRRISEQLSAPASANREDRRKSVALFASMAKQRPVIDEEDNMMAKCNQIAEYSRVLMTYLPSFWKIHAFYLASTFAAKGERSKPSAAIKHKKEVEKLAKEIVELYASRVRSLFAAIVNEEAKIAATNVSSQSQSTAEDEEQEDTENTKEGTDNNTRRKARSQQRESAASHLDAHGDQTRPIARQNRTRLDKTNRNDKKQNEERRSFYLAMLLLCVEEVKKCFEGLKELKMPRAYMEGIYEVLHDFTRTYIDATANHFIHIISRLGEEETWEVEQIDFGDILGFNHLLSERRSDSFLVKTTTTSEALGEPTTGFMHTTLPSLFMTKLTDVLQMQFQGLGIGSIHTATLEEPSLASLVLDFQVAAFQTFQETLQRLAKEVFSTNVEGSEEDDDTVEKKLVLVLGNCTFTRNQVVPQIFELLYSLFHGNDSAAKRELAQTYLQDSMKKINSSMEQLEEWLIDAFVQQKSNNLISIIRNGLLHTPISAKHLSVSNYVIQLLLQLVNVHHQLSSSSSSFSSSSSLTRKERKNSSTSILSRLVDHVFNAFLSSLRDLDKGEGSNGVATLLSSSSSPSSSSALSSADTSTKEWGKQKLQLSSEDLHAKKKDSKKKAVNDPKAILLQIERDVRFVEGVMRNYIDDDAKSYLRSLDGLLEKWYARFGDLSASARKKATKGALLENAKSKTWLLFSCF